MKPKKINGRLVLNKRTIADLKNRDMGKIRVGIDYTTNSAREPECPLSCIFSCPCGNTD